MGGRGPRHFRVCVRRAELVPLISSYRAELKLVENNDCNSVFVVRA